MTGAEYKALRESMPLVTSLFANGDGTASTVAWNDPEKNTSGSRFINYAEGIPPDYATPYRNFGKRALRKDINAIGNLATRELFLLQHGGYHTFDLRVAEVIGGYPYGAILDWYQESTGWMRKVRCVKEGGNCFTPIDDEENGLGSGEPHWAIVDILETESNKDGTVKTQSATTPKGGMGGAFWGGYVLRIPEGTKIQPGKTAKSEPWVAPFNAKFSLPYTRSGAKSPRDSTVLECFNPYVLVTDSNGVASSLKSRFYLEVTGENCGVLEIPTAKSFTPSTGEPVSNSSYKSFVDSMYRTIPRMFLKKGTAVRFCCTNMSSAGQMDVYGYAKFDLEEVV